MAITVEFNVPAMTVGQYDEVMKRLADQDLANPKGRSFHVAGPHDDGWFVLDVWQSEAELDEFAQALMPLLGSLGIAPPAPVVRRVHNAVPSV